MDPGNLIRTLKVAAAFCRDFDPSVTIELRPQADRDSRRERLPEVHRRRHAASVPKAYQPNRFGRREPETRRLTWLEACRSALAFVEWYRRMALEGRIIVTPEAPASKPSDYALQRTLQTAIGSAEGDAESPA